jgi:outer membrane protein
LRVLSIIPDSRLTVDNTSILGKAQNSVVPEMDVSYFFTKNIAAELILGASPHKLKLTSPAAVNGFTLAEPIMLPPTLTLQYHFTDFGAFKPYVGVGVNYTWFLGQNPKGLDAISIKGNVAPAFQVGFDYFLDQHWGINFDVKKLLLRTTYNANASTALGVASIHGNARLDPWIIGAGISYRF